MKTVFPAAILLVAILLVGCVVTSVYPYYQAKQVTFDPALAGVWAKPDVTNAASSGWTFVATTNQTYLLTTKDPSETNEFTAQLFTLKAERFIDCLSRNRIAYSTPTHLLLRVHSISPELQVEILNFEWLAKLVEKNPKAIRHVIVPNDSGNTQDGGQLVLTADTAELQKFILNHLHDTNAWTRLDTMVKH